MVAKRRWGGREREIGFSSESLLPVAQWVFVRHLPSGLATTHDGMRGGTFDCIKTRLPKTEEVTRLSRWANQTDSKPHGCSWMLPRFLAFFFVWYCWVVVVFSQKTTTTQRTGWLRCTSDRTCISSGEILASKTSHSSWTSPPSCFSSPLSFRCSY